MAYATSYDVGVELGRPAASTEEAAQWGVWLERVERTVRRRFTREGYDLDEQIALGSPTIEDLVDVEVTRVAEKANNPSGYTSTTRSIDDASVTVRREGVESGDGLTITDAEWTALLPVRPKSTHVFSVLPS